MVEDRMVVVDFDGLLISVWAGSPTQSRLVRWIRTIEGAIKEHPHGISVLSAIRMDGESQGPGARDYARRELLRLSPSLRRFVIYPVGSSLMVSLVRPIIRTMFMMSPMTRQFTLVTDEADAVGAIYSSKGPPRAELAAALKLALERSEELS